ncbi:MAG: RidA family protein [Hyphomicrobiaceae bacterium]|jgi:enamine deaminase RidA (YjgF/YER057c/UK114 family)
MIERFTGMTPTRSRAVAYKDLVYTVAIGTTPTAGLYEQTREALARIDRNLADAGTDKSRILRATVFITDMNQKDELNRAWDEWVDKANPPQRACIGVTLEAWHRVEILITAVR